MSDCPFCQIIDGELDSYSVFENEYAYAFLDINPSTDGHTLVVPREHAETITDLSDDLTGPFFEAVTRVTAGIDDAMNPDGINLLQSNREAAGQEIDHAHMHILPRDENDEIEISYSPTELDEKTATELKAEIGEAI